MRTLIRLEELGMLLLSILLFSMTGYAWWWYLALILVPDVSMVGYLVDSRAGAALYNFVHHRGLAITVYLVGYFLVAPLVQMTGVILFAHSSLDRLFGYGLKFSDSFRHTHLGWIGDGGEGEDGRDTPGPV